MPSLVHLSRLTRRLAEIPYENVTKILARERGYPAFPVFESPLSSDAGGTCFAVTRYAYELLSASGYEAYPVMADRSYGPNTHCALIVAVEGKKYLVDPGFLLPLPVPLGGSHVFTGFNSFFLVPPPLRGGVSRKTSAGRQKANCALFPDARSATELAGGEGDPEATLSLALSPQGRGEMEQMVTYVAYTEHLGQVKFRYRFVDRRVSWDEFFAHWRSSFNWSSMNSVVITALRDSKQFYLHGCHLRVIGRDRVTRSTITPADLLGVSKQFGIEENLIREAFEITGSFNHDRAVGRAHRSLVKSTVEEKGCS